MQEYQLLPCRKPQFLPHAGKALDADDTPSSAFPPFSFRLVIKSKWCMKVPRETKRAQHSAAFAFLMMAWKIGLMAHHH